MKTALLVIDMQRGSFTPETPRYDADGVVNRINTLAQAVRENKGAVVWIQHEGSPGEMFVPGNPDWKLLKGLKTSEEDYRIGKTANDVFYQSSLEELLQSLGITHLMITGCATDFCVESTIQSAITRDYEVTVIADGHTTADRPDLNAKQVIDHYNWVWQNMLPTKGSIKVISTNEQLRITST